MTQNRVLLMFAMESEALPFFEALELDEEPNVLDPDLPFRTFSGRRNSWEVVGLVNGKDARYGVDNIGPEPATLAAYVGISKYAPDLVISAGTAGGFRKKGASIADVYLSETPFVFHDRRILIPGFAEYGIGTYPSVDASDLAKELGLKTGVISTGSSLAPSPQDFDAFEQSGAVVKEMEAAAIAWVCQLKKVSFLAVKSVTDLVDESLVPEKDFVKNLGEASRALSKSLVRILDSPISLDL